MQLDKLFLRCDWKQWAGVIVLNERFKSNISSKAEVWKFGYIQTNNVSHNACFYISGKFIIFSQKNEARSALWSRDCGIKSLNFFADNPPQHN